jgi:hypothetical protein
MHKITIDLLFRGTRNLIYEFIVDILSHMSWTGCYNKDDKLVEILPSFKQNLYFQAFIINLNAMENTDQKQENKDMPKDPKPGDEVQKHIETVIPESESPEGEIKTQEEQSESQKDGKSEGESATANREKAQSDTDNDIDGERDQIE